MDIHDRSLGCPRCGDLLEITYAPCPIDPGDLKNRWRRRLGSHDFRDRSGVWRFREFLPDLYEPDDIVTLEEGNVPLLLGAKSAHWAGLDSVTFKHLGWNPTGCFKDLGMTVGMTEAKYHNVATVACASTGNTAASLSAYAARAGIAARVYLPKGAVSLAKLAQSLDHGAEVVEIDGNFDQALNELLKTAGADLYFLNSINPFRIEGQKTVIFELLDELEWCPPDFVVVPGGNLGNTAAFGKALSELKAAGLIDRTPHLVVVQAEGANPLVRAWENGSNRLEPLAEPKTAATAIRIGAPRSWKKALRALRFTDGVAMDVTDDEIAEAKSIIGRDGIGCEPASATTLAGIRQLVRSGRISKDASVVAILTGHVLKDTDYVMRTHRSQIAEQNEQSSRTRTIGSGTDVNAESSANGSCSKRAAMETELIDISVPASIANLGPGLDTLAVAVKLYLRLRVRRLAGPSNRLHFDFGNLELGGENYIERAFRCIASRECSEFPSLAVEVHSEIPLRAGLGSSAAATVAGLRLYEAVTRPRSAQELLQIASELEGHPDNAAAALFGGLASSCQVRGSVMATSSAWPSTIHFIVLTPEMTLETPVSRRVLPNLISRTDAIFNVQRVALLFQALQSGDYRLLKEALRDRWHQPFRHPLVPGLQKALQLEHPDLLGVCLSGAGPSIVALAENNHDEVAHTLAQAYASLQIAYKMRILSAQQPSSHSISSKLAMSSPEAATFSPALRGNPVQVF